MRRFVQFDEWYFSFEYQIPFSCSIFALTFLLSNALPLILGLGCLFFSVKYYIEFRERLLFPANSQGYNSINGEETLKFGKTSSYRY